MDPLSQKALALIFDYEGLDQPGEWPGGASGVTIGIGYDLGYVTSDEFDSDWKDCLREEDCQALAAVIGFKGNDAKARASQVAHIRLTSDQARRVFVERSVPNYQKLTAQAFPGFDKLPADAQGALVSLVYNRGAGMNGDSRREMRAVRDAVAKGDLKEIANQIRAMKRLWVNTNLTGLVKRREAEAQLVESCITSTS
jgi:GH24 family phage-related lysozyme (muramidase)